MPMRKLLLIFAFILVASPGFAQDFYWATVKDPSADPSEFVPLSEATSEVLSLYDRFDYYSIVPASATRILGGLVSKEYRRMLRTGETQDRAIVFAIGETERTTTIAMVTVVRQDGMDMLIFGYNKDIDRSEEMISTLPGNRDRFESWFETLLE